MGEKEPRFIHYLLEVKRSNFVNPESNHLCTLFTAVREDRMPGGRNSGAVYNLYKVSIQYVVYKFYL